MQEPAAGADRHTDTDAWADPRVEIRTLLDDLPDQVNQVLLDYLKELLAPLL